MVGGPSSPISWHLLPQVDDLKAKLAIQEAELKQKNENADRLIHVVGVETEKVSKEKAIADEEEVKVEVINKVGRRAWPLWAVALPGQAPHGPRQRLGGFPHLQKLRGGPSAPGAVVAFPGAGETCRFSGPSPALLNQVCILTRCP